MVLTYKVEGALGIKFELTLVSTTVWLQVCQGASNDLAHVCCKL